MGLDRPVLIAGTARSGKTCVWDLLAQSDEFTPVREPLTIWDAGVRLAHDRWTEAQATPEVRRAILESCERIVGRSGRRRYLDNLAYHALRLPFVHAVLPDALVIHTVRDPWEALPECLFGWTNRDTVRRSVAWRWRHLRWQSLPHMGWRFARNYLRSRTRGVRETWGPTPPGLQEIVKSRTPAEIAAWQWARIVETSLDDLERLPGIQALQVRHEDLISDPRREAMRIVEFADVANPAPLVDYAVRTFRKDYVHYENTVRELTSEDWERVRPILAPLRRRLGYATDGEQVDRRSA
jgi:hypothetical protein